MLGAEAASWARLEAVEQRDLELYGSSGSGAQWQSFLTAPRGPPAQNSAPPAALKLSPKQREIGARALQLLHPAESAWPAQGRGDPRGGHLSARSYLRSRQVSEFGLPSMTGQQPTCMCVQSTHSMLSSHALQGANPPREDPLMAIGMQSGIVVLLRTGGRPGEFNPAQILAGSIFGT